MKSKIENYLTIEQARELFEIKGADVVWRVDRNSVVKAGHVAGYKNLRGYRQIHFRCPDGIKRSVLAHHIAFGLHHGRWANSQVDHKNGVRFDNGVLNLREATSQINNQNRRVAANSKLGVKGVHYNANRPRAYRAQLQVDGVHVFRKTFKTLEEATVAILAARVLHHGEFANHG